MSYLSSHLSHITRFLIIAACAALPLVEASHAHAQTKSTCFDDQIEATDEHIAALTKLGHLDVPRGSCFPKAWLQSISAAADVITELGTYACPGFSVGYDANMSPATLKENRIYFNATTGGKTVGMDPKFLVCARDYLKAAKDAGLRPCIRAALRTTDHQRASCLDKSNSVVCGRSSGCTSFNSCRHVMGIAMDINSGSGDYARLHSLASQFGLTYPYANDRPHIEATANCRTPNFDPTKAPSSPTSTSQPPTSQPTGSGTQIPQPPAMTQPPVTAQQPVICPAGSIGINGQCIPTTCNGITPYAVVSTNPLQTVWCQGTSILGTGQTSAGPLLGGMLSGGMTQPYTGGLQGGIPGIMSGLMRLISGQQPQIGYPTGMLGTGIGGSTLPTGALTPVYTSTGQVAYVPTSQFTGQPLGGSAYPYSSAAGFYAPTQTFVGSTLGGYSYTPQSGTLLQQLLISLRAAVVTILSAIGATAPTTTPALQLEYDTTHDVDAL